MSLKSSVSGQTPAAYAWDFDGSWLTEWHRFMAPDWLSVGIFRWLQTKDGKRLKRGPVQIRLRAPQHKREHLLRSAAEATAVLNAAPFREDQLEHIVGAGLRPGSRAIPLSR